MGRTQPISAASLPQAHRLAHRLAFSVTAISPKRDEPGSGCTAAGEDYDLQAGHRVFLSNASQPCSPAPVNEPLVWLCGGFLKIRCRLSNGNDTTSAALTRARPLAAACAATLAAAALVL